MTKFRLQQTNHTRTFNSQRIASAVVIINGLFSGILLPLNAKAIKTERRTITSTHEISTATQSSSSLQITQAQASQVASAEQILAEINRLRESPQNYAAWLETLRPYYSGEAFRFPGERGIRTVEGIAALDGAIAALSSRQPVPPLTLSPGLVQSTHTHLTELLSTNRFTLTGIDGSTPLTRAERYGSLEGGNLNELLNEGFSSAEAIVAALVIEDGNRARTAQDALLSSEITTLGTACGVGSSNRPLCVVDYATAYTTTATASIATSSDSNWFGTPSAAQLSALENDLITETNRLRENPAAYAEKLVSLRDYYEGQLVKVPGQPIVEVVEGVAALNEAIAVLQQSQPITTLTASQGMAHGANDHAIDLGENGLIGHYGSDGSDPFVRMGRYGRWDEAAGNVAGENISYGQAASAEWHIVQLLIDDNVPDRGHREALLRPNYRQMGTACEAHPEFRIVCVMTYASEYQERP